MEEKSFYTILESELIFDKRLSPTCKILYAIICSYSNNSNGYCYLRYSQLANMIGLSIRQFRRCISDLRILNYITIFNRNNRNFIMPTINKAVEDRKNNNNWIEYDWLEENLKKN